MIREDWGRLLYPGLNKVFQTRMRSREELSKRTQVFGTQSSKLSSEEFQGIGELSADNWASFEKTGRVSYDENRAGWLTRLKHGEFAKGVIIERKLLEDNQYPAAGIPNAAAQRINALADSSALFREKAAASVLNYAFTDSGVDNIIGASVAGADGVGLCSDAHPDAPGASTTQDNEGTSAFDTTSVAATRLAMSKFKDDRGEVIASHPDTLIVPPALEDKALVLTKSMAVPGSPNNDVNVHAGRYKVIVWDYLTSDTAWFMADSALMREHLIWLDRVTPEFSVAEDFDTIQTKYRGYQRFSRGWDDWRFIYGQKP